MRTLCIDTCGFFYSLAIIENNKVICELFSDKKQMQCEELILRIQQMLLENGLSYSDIESICVTTGPGTFNGTRIGIGAAYGISIAKKIKIYGVNTLEMISYKAMLQGHNFPLNVCFLADNLIGFIQEFYLDGNQIRSKQNIPERIELSKHSNSGYINFDVNNFDLLDSKISNAAAAGMFLIQSNEFVAPSLFYGKPPSINGH